MIFLKMHVFHLSIRFNTNFLKTRYTPRKKSLGKIVRTNNSFGDIANLKLDIYELLKIGMCTNGGGSPDFDEVVLIWIH